MKKLFDGYDSAWKQIVVPEKLDFHQSMGLAVQQNSKGDLLKRHEFTVHNRNGQKLRGFIMINQSVPQCELPCLIYLHSHSGNKAESMSIAEFVLDNFNLCSFDFSAYGDSEGEYSTLGLKEHLDLRAVVDYLRDNLDIEDIYLWGRSMGAVTAILFVHHHRDMVLDSPFTEAKTMICDLITSRASVPRFLIKTALMPISSTIKKKTGYDVLSNNPVDFVQSIDVPTYTFVGREDKISRPDRVKEMHAKFSTTNKHFELVDGEHNSYRDDEIVVGAINWVKIKQEERMEVKRKAREEQATLAHSIHEMHHDKGRRVF